MGAWSLSKDVSVVLYHPIRSSSDKVSLSIKAELMISSWKQSTSHSHISFIVSDVSLEQKKDQNVLGPLLHKIPILNNPVLSYTVCRVMVGVLFTLYQLKRNEGKIENIKNNTTLVLGRLKGLHESISMSY